MHTIEVDFEVLKTLMGLRKTEDVTYNDVIRSLLKLEPKPQAPEAGGPWPDDWVVKGVRFKEGTEFRARHNGRVHVARVEKAALVLNGKRYDSPSAAAVSITGYAVNGWNFWEFRSSRDGEWKPMASSRKVA